MALNEDDIRSAPPTCPGLMAMGLYAVAHRDQLTVPRDAYECKPDCAWNVDGKCAIVVIAEGLKTKPQSERNCQNCEVLPSDKSPESARKCDECTDWSGWHPRPTCLHCPSYAAGSISPDCQRCVHLKPGPVEPERRWCNTCRHNGVAGEHCSKCDDSQSEWERVLTYRDFDQGMSDLLEPSGGVLWWLRLSREPR